MTHPLRPSNRMAMVQDPIIPIVADLIKKTPGVISLGQGVVNYGPPPVVLDKIKQFQTSKDYHLYSSVEGMEELINVVRDKLKKDNNIHASEEHKIVITAGANMAFLNALFAITDPGDEIILLRPYYFNHDMAINMLNCKTIIVDTDDYYQPILKNIECALTEKTRAIVTVSPNNPSGSIYSQEVLTAINELCLKNNVYHISDEAYEYFTYDDNKHFSVASLPNRENHTISIFSLSKSYGFASWRIGYMLIPSHLYSATKKVQDTNLICPPRICQEAAILALREGQSYCKANIAEISEVREELYSALQSINDICFTTKSAGAFYFLVKLNTQITSMKITEELIKKHKIAVIPGETFGLDDGCYIRIAYAALDRETTNIGIQRLIDGLRSIIRM